VFDRAAWAERAQQADDGRRDRAQIMAADPRLGFERMLRCDQCGTLFSDRVPGEAALEEFYRHYYGNDGYLGKLRAKLGLKQRRLWLLKFLVRGRRFLDVGCNIGCAVEAARRNGFDATGLELGAAAVSIARKYFPRNRFIAGTVAALPLGSQFDLVYCTDVIEHVPDPADFVRLLAGAVAPNGVLFLTTPDAGHWRVRDALLDWGEVKPPEHLTLFTRAGLCALCAPYFRSVYFVPSAKPGVHMIARR
jgi:SAM-dependent methyltransferase